MSFNILVCVKQVPDSDKVRIDPKTGSLIRKGVPVVLNADDCNALEEALRIKDRFADVHVTAVTMGPPQAREVLIEAIAKGADEGILVCDPALANSDTIVTSSALARAINKWADANGGYSLVIAGKESSDGDTAQVGPQIAEHLNIPQITFVSQLDMTDDMNSVTAVRMLDGCTETIEANPPCLITATKNLNAPRYPHMRNVFGPKNITQWTAADLQLDASQVGLEGSSSVVISSFSMKRQNSSTYIEGEDGREKALNLLSILHDRHEI